MKRIICILALCLGLIALMTSCSFFSFSTEGLEYIELEDGSYAVKAGEAIDLEEIVIPNTYNGKPVTQIAAEGFKEASNLKDVTIPKNVTVIGESAFEGCIMLKNVKVADNSALKKIEKSAFNECRTLLHINIPEGVTEIGEKAFYYCTSMTNITIPSTVKTVGREAFYFCISLYKVTHRGDVSISVGNTGNIIVTVDKDGTVNYPSKNWILTDDDFLFRSYDGKYDLIAYVGSKETVTFPRDYNGNPYNIVYGRGARKVIIPKEITDIGEQAFTLCQALESVEFPNTLTSIGKDAFSGCVSLESVVIPSSVTSISESAFISCDRLSKIEVNILNPNYKSVDGNLYTKDGKTLLLYAIGKEEKSFTVPLRVKKIGGYAFAYTTNLESVVVPNNVSSIGNMAFFRSTIKNIELSEGLTDIGDHAFDSCDNLEKIDLPEGLINIGASAFAFSSKITELIIPDSVVSIGDEAFKCMEITSIVIPDNVTEIGVRMFEGCGCLTEVIIGSGVTSIGTYAFFRCSALESITIPANVKTINKGAFQGCSKLKSVVSEGKYWINVSNSISSDPASMAKYLTGSGVNSKISR